ncbi:MAG: peptidoglycan editing factor PgeF [Saccharofermentanales bacterium]
MISHDQPNGVRYLTFETIDRLPDIRHAFSTRKGGVSSAIFESMNLGFNRGDDNDNVKQNFRIFCEATGIDSHSLVFGAQTHSTNVRRVFASDRGSGIDRAVPWNDIDGLATNEPGVFLTTFYADCVPLYFVDTIRHAIALSHAGWRGTVSNIADATIQRMAAEFGSIPSDIHAAIGPSIGICCFEVGEEVADVFMKLPGSFSEGCIRLSADECGKSAAESGGQYEAAIQDEAPARFFIDLQEINRRMMVTSGILPQNIEVAGICTSCNSQWLFSHRASGGKRGSLCAMIGIIG